MKMNTKTMSLNVCSLKFLKTHDSCMLRSDQMANTQMQLHTKPEFYTQLSTADFPGGKASRQK